MNLVRLYCFCLLLGFTLCSQILSGQQSSVDSLLLLLQKTKQPKSKVDLYNQLSEKYRGLQPKEGVHYATEALKLANEIHYDGGIADAYNNMGVNYTLLGDHTLPIEFLSKALKIYEKKNDLAGIAKTLGHMGFTYGHKGDYTKSMEYQTKALGFYEKLNDADGSARMLNNIGLLFQRQNQYGKALEYYERSLDLSNEIKDMRVIASAFSNMGIIYTETKDYKKAEEYYKRSLEINKQIESLYIVTSNIGNLGLVYMYLQDWEKSESHFHEALKLSRQMDNKELIGINHGSLGTMYLEKAKEEPDSQKRNQLVGKSVDHIGKATDIFKETGDIHHYQEYSQYLSDAYHEKGDYKKALEAFREHSRYKDSIFNEEKRNEFNRWEMNYEFAKKEDSIRLENEKEIAIRDATLAEKETQKWLYIGSLVLVTIIGILLFYQNRLRKKKNEELDEANRIKTQFFSILNHDLRSPVGDLVYYLFNKKENPEALKGEVGERLEAQTMESAKNLLVSMEDLLLWSKGQMENFKPQPENIPVENIFNDLRRFFSQKENITVIFENSQQIELFTDKNYLKTIMRNLTSNAVKALANVEKAKIIWRAKEENGHTVLSITDNGPGVTNEKFRALYDEKEVVGIKTGLGLHLVRDMAKAINCKVTVNTRPGKGTVISLVFRGSGQFYG